MPLNLRADQSWGTMPAAFGWDANAMTLTWYALPSLTYLGLIKNGVSILRFNTKWKYIGYYELTFGSVVAHEMD